MEYREVVFGEFIERPNRFVAKVRVDGCDDIEAVHVKNTGRCRELLVPGARVALETAQTDGAGKALQKQTRKTKYDLVAVVKENLAGNGPGWVNMDSQAPNKIVKEWLEVGGFPGGNLTLIKPEHKFGNSRIDFYCEAEDPTETSDLSGTPDGKRRILIEVKGCTLEVEGQGYFPDAPSERAVKHLKELAEAAKNGYECYIAYAITMAGVSSVKPNIETHPQYGETIAEAIAAGVRTLFLECEVQPDCLCINKCTRVINTDTMRRSDAYTIANLTPSRELMYKAGRGIFESVCWRTPVAIVAGKGNNAGDGYVVAKMLKDNDVDCRVFLLDENRFSQDGAYYFEKCRDSGVPFEQFTEDTDLSKYGSILDCLLGTGFAGDVRGIAKTAIDEINRCGQLGSYVVAADINSGLNGDTGEGSTFVKSDLTVSIGDYKYGHFLGKAGEAMKDKINCHIGIELV